MLLDPVQSELLLKLNYDENAQTGQHAWTQSQRKNLYDTTNCARHGEEDEEAFNAIHN